MENIIKELYQKDDKLAYEAIKLARQNKDKINDYLLEEIKKIDKNFRKSKLDYIPIFIDRAIFILAEFKEKRLFPILMDLLNNPKIKSFDDIGMVVMDKLPTIVASVFDGNFKTLNNVLENKNVDDYTRSRLMASYIYFYENNLITKEDLEAYLRKLIKLYNDQQDDIYNELIDVITTTKLTDMIEDVRILFQKNIVNLDYNGGYDRFIDDLFNYDKTYQEKIYQVEDAIKELSRFDKFNESNEEILNKFSEFIEEDIANNINPYSKVGRNDPCPCGSGKKFKKCCINQQKDFLPYQGYIDNSLAEYPKKNNNKEEIDFYTYYKEEYINIDKLLYKALKYKSVPRIIKRDMKAESMIEYNALNEAYSLIKEVLNNNKFNSIEEYDKEVSIHYSLYKFLAKYSQLIIDRIKEDKTKYLPKLEELITTFNNNFDIETNIIFMNMKNSFYILGKKQKEGIEYFSNLLLKHQDKKVDIYGYLFDEYMSYYDYDIAKAKIEEAISKEKDKKLVKYLQELKLEFLDEEDY